MSNTKKYVICMAICAFLSAIGIFCRISGTYHELYAGYGAIISGISIFSAAFLLLWACDAAQSFLPQAIALAIVALIAVLPEYAVDMYFTWMAGQEFLAGSTNPEHAHFAIANMTGANRIIIGIAWVIVIAIAYFKTKNALFLDKERRLELFALGLASVYALVIVIKGSLTLIDTVVFIGIYVWYIFIAGKRPITEVDVDGPAEVLLSCPGKKRNVLTFAIFIFSAIAIFSSAEPFSESLAYIGKTQTIVPEFYVVQWLAPIASEAPEFIVAIMFACRGAGSMALGSLLSAKLNQWTLLVGMIPLVYAISTKQIVTSLPMSEFQIHEILLTAAQSLLALFILARLRVTIWHGIILFVLFIGQLIAPILVKSWGIATVFMEFIHSNTQITDVSQLFTILYFISALIFIIHCPKRLQVFNYKLAVSNE